MIFIHDNWLLCPAKKRTEEQEGKRKKLLRQPKRDWPEGQQLRPAERISGIKCSRASRMLLLLFGWFCLLLLRWRREEVLVGYGRAVSDSKKKTKKNFNPLAVVTTAKNSAQDSRASSLASTVK
jgi:hypothetical protein